VIKALLIDIGVVRATFISANLRTATSTLSFEALREPFSDRLDIFSDVINVKITPVLLFLSEYCDRSRPIRPGTKNKNPIRKRSRPSVLTELT
jgi:hypothetical protein